MFQSECQKRCRQSPPLYKFRLTAIQDVSTTAQMHLLYTRFKSVSSQLSPLLGELERRAQAHPTELSALLTECHTAYFSVRKALLVGRLTEEIKGLDPGRTELVELVRFSSPRTSIIRIDFFLSRLALGVAT